MRSIAVGTLLSLVILIASTAYAAEGFPQFQTSGRPQSMHGMTPDQQKMVEAYLPPPPIRHSWPGGYRVLLHELVNTFMDHMTGRY